MKNMAKRAIGVILHNRNKGLFMYILYVSTVSETMGFFSKHIEMLLQQGHSVDFACAITKSIDHKSIMGNGNIHDLRFSRSPLSTANFSGYKLLRRIIQEGDYDIIHTHTPVASALVRICCRKNENITVIYTAHGFHFYRGAPWKNWLIYYPIEKWLSRHTNILITINKEDYDRAKKGFKAGRVEYVPGVGVDIAKYRNVAVDRETKKRQLGLVDDDLVLVSTGELNNNKNHKTVIRALGRLSNPKIKYLICGHGSLKGKLLGLINELGLQRQVTLLGYRTDVIEINHIADIFVFPSFREGLSVAMMEAMSCSLPIVCSNIRGNRDLIDNGKGGFLKQPSDVDGFAQSIKTLIESRQLRESMGEYNTEKIGNYASDIVLDKMRNIYESVVLRDGYC